MIKEINKANFWAINWLDEYMAGHKGFICGGCFKNIFNNEKVKDLDIFFESMEDWEDAVEYFDSMCNEADGYRFYYENKNVKAYKHIDKGITIELCNKVFGTAKEVIDKFDFTITKFAYYKEEVEDLDGKRIEYKVACDSDFFEHLHMKRLVTDNEIPYPMSTFERMLRYAKYGYFPCKETKMKIIEAIRALPESAIELSDSLYDGMD